MTTNGRLSLLSVRGRTALAIAMCTAVAVLVGPALPAQAVPMGDPVQREAPTDLTATYNGLSATVQVSWTAVEQPVDEETAPTYLVNYVNAAGSEVDAAVTAPPATITDLGYDRASVNVRAVYADLSWGPRAEFAVTRGSLANLQIEVERVPDASIYLTLNSHNAFEAALSNARALVAADTAEGAPVGAAFVALQNAAAARVDYSALVAAIAEVGSKDNSADIPVLSPRFTEALAAAQALSTSAATDPLAAITPTAISAAHTELIAAYLAAIAAPVRLGKLLTQAEVWVAGSSAAGYTTHSSQTVRAAIAAAHVALADRFATSTSLDAAADVLAAAWNSRVPRPDTFSAALARYSALALDDFSAASRRIAAAAHSAALEEDASSAATSQSLADVGTSLDDAIDALVDLSPLRAAIAANDPALFTENLYTATAWRALTDAFAASVQFVTDATAARAAPVTTQRVDALVATLTNALKNLLPVPSITRAPGLYVQVIDGLIHVINPAGSVTFAAGQFGFTPSFVQPPIVVPTNPGLQFSPPPAFLSGVTISAPDTESASCTTDPITKKPVCVAKSTPAKTYCGGEGSSIDCIVRSATTGAVRGVATSVAPLTARSVTIASRFGSTAATAAAAATAATATALAPASAVAHTSLAAAAAPSGYILATVLAPTYPANGRLNITIPLPSNALTGTLFFQYTYNGVSYQTAARIDIVPPSYAYAARTELASTGIDSGPLLGGALALLVIGCLFSARRSRRSTRA